jgi:hypothetical protein
LIFWQSGTSEDVCIDDRASLQGVARGTAAPEDFCMLWLKKGSSDLFTK